MAGDEEHCKHIAPDENQWLCYFLPMTNCSIPLLSEAAELRWVT
jgi:hypothetical protein